MRSFVLELLLFQLLLLLLLLLLYICVCVYFLLHLSRITWCYCGYIIWWIFGAYEHIACWTARVQRHFQQQEESEEEAAEAYCHIVRCILS